MLAKFLRSKTWLVGDDGNLKFYIIAAREATHTERDHEAVHVSYIGKTLRGYEHASGFYPVDHAVRTAIDFNVNLELPQDAIRRSKTRCPKT